MCATIIAVDEVQEPVKRHDEDMLMRGAFLEVCYCRRSIDAPACLEGEVGNGTAVCATDCMDFAVRRAKDNLQQTISIDITSNGVLQKDPWVA